MELPFLINAIKLGEESQLISLSLFRIFKTRPIQTMQQVHIISVAPLKTVKPFVQTSIKPFNLVEKPNLSCTTLQS
jgi:hypothetical protein